MIDALGRDRVRLQRIVVGRRDDRRTAAPEVIDDGRAQRAALDRVGAAPDLVEQDERGRVECAIHRDDVGDVRRKTC